MKLKEKDIAAKVVEWLHDNKWEVYQEVVCLGSRADIVAVLKPIIWIIECKCTLSFGVISQAYNWKNYCHISSIAVPATQQKRNKARQYATYCINRDGIGTLEVYRNRLRHKKGVLNRNPIYIEKMRKSLNEGQKTSAKAGTRYGGYWTPFKQTSIDLTNYVLSNPGCSVKQAIDSITHHYSKDSVARACISRYIFNGVIQGLYIKQDGKKLTLYPAKKSVVGQFKKDR